MEETEDAKEEAAGPSGEQKEDEKPKPNRCDVCKKRVGLTAIVCRCGRKFCGIHRYPSEHSCTFDYRAMGAEEIRRNNPVVKAAKMNQI